MEPSFGLMASLAGLRMAAVAFAASAGVLASGAWLVLMRAGEETLRAASESAAIRHDDLLARRGGDGWYRRITVRLWHHVSRAFQRASRGFGGLAVAAGRIDRRLTELAAARPPRSSPR